MKQRDLSLDIVRVIACILVVLMHSPMPSPSANGTFLGALSYFTMPCIGLFFMVSGALLLPVKTDCFTFLRRRLSKIVVPTLIWTAVYLCLGIYFSESEINILQAVMSVPFSAQGHGVLWFMYTLSGLYLLAPVISPWLKEASNNEIGFILILWCVTLCYPFLKYGIVVNSGTTGILYYFTGYAGYFLLGYFLKHRITKLPVIYPIVIASAGIGLILFLKSNNITTDFYEMFGYTSIFTAATCCAIWIMVMKMSGTAIASTRRCGGGKPLIINELSNTSFGIYLVHIVIMRYWLWRTEWIQSINSYILQTVTIALLTIILSTIVCLLISRTRITTYLIGYRKR